MEPYLLSATEVVALTKSGKLTVEDYARSLLGRVEKRDAAVKAWEYLNPELIMAEAKKLDQVAPEKRGPLHGVAIGVKDVIYTKDMPTGHNSPIYKDDAPALDAGCVMILRNAGALIFGKTCTTEFAASTQGPKTSNPHDPARTPGGSSSGSGAAVGDFQVPISLGTQTGGSTIRPGSFNGVYAMKPTWGAITREGQKIYSLQLDTLGLFARSVEDLGLLCDVFALKDDVPPPTEGVPVKGAKFALVKGPVWSQVGPGTAAAMEKAAGLLKAAGAEVEEVELPAGFEKMPAWHKTMMHTEGGVAFLADYRCSKANLDDFLVGFVENVDGFSRTERLRAFDGIAALRPQIDEFAAKYTAILTPSVPDEAPVGRWTGDASFNNMWTALHVPVTNIPGFKGEHGMPIGLSLLTGRYRDQHLLAVSKAVGQIFEAEGGWKREVY